jgi:CarD family transcriptional regulator
MFAEGDMTVYPAHGVGEIESIQQQVVAGIDQKFYVIKIIDSNMTVMIPVDTSDNVGLRGIISKRQVTEVMAILKEKDIAIKTQTWNRRYRDYMEKIKTGSAYEIAAVLRDLYLLSSDKELSYGERKMKETAKKLLVTEISLAKKVKEERVAKQIDKIFA